MGTVRGKLPEPASDRLVVSIEGKEILGLAVEAEAACCCCNSNPGVGAAPATPCSGTGGVATAKRAEGIPEVVEFRDRMVLQLLVPSAPRS